MIGIALCPACHGDGSFRRYGNLWRWLTRRPVEVVRCPVCKGAGIVAEELP